MKRIIQICRQGVLVGLLLSVFLLIMGSEGLAQQVKKVGTSAAVFLKIPVGARAISMGSAFVATADDPSALYWNPGGLPRIGKYALMVDHSPWLPNITFNFIGLVMPVPTFGTVGISVTALTTAEMDVTTPANPMGTGEKFDAASVAVGISYGRSLTDWFTIGGTVKYINERIFNSSATGIGFDVGTIYNTPLPGLRLGFSVSNFGSKMRINGEDLNIRANIDPGQLGTNQSIVAQLKTDEFDLPLLMRLGLSYDAWQSEDSRVTVAVDGINPNDNAQSLNVGAEAAFLNEILIISGGFNELFLEDREKGLTLGASFNPKFSGNLGVNIGYAFQDFQHLPNVNRFTLTVSF
jgi:hypothetical protein